MAPKTGQEALHLPEALNGSRAGELEKLWAFLAKEGGGQIDGSGVRSLDSEGIRLLLQGLAGPADGTVVANPSSTLLAARRALRLEDRITVNPDDAQASNFTGRRLGEVLVDLGLVDERAGAS